jgi:hypothetical protein
MPQTFYLDDTALSEGTKVYDINMGQGVVKTIAPDYVEVVFVGGARVIANHSGEVAGRRRLFATPPALFSFSSAEQRNLALGIMALVGATLR